MSEPLERYSRVNDRLLDGCEAAYTAIADEFHSDSPDWQSMSIGLGAPCRHLSCRARARLSLSTDGRRLT